MQTANRPRRLPGALLCSVAALSSLMALTACSGGEPEPAPPANDDGTGALVLTFAGSTTVQPLAKKLGERFRVGRPDVTLSIVAGGSVVGIRAVHHGDVDIGMASRMLRMDEQAGVDQHRIATDVLALVVHPDNPVKDLTLRQVRDIYNGTVRDWAELGGPAGPIVPIQREKTSGTRGAFDTIALGKVKAVAPNLKSVITAGDVVAAVSSDPNAIGYVGFGHLDAQRLAPVSIAGVAPSPRAALDGTYPLQRPLLLLTGPLSRDIARDFVTFAVGAEGQAIVRDTGWIANQ